MANVRPFFITGAAAKVILNGKTMAFCSDLSYSVQIITQTPKVLGMYEGTSVEPLGYSVSGSFTVIRYAKGAVANNGFSVPGGVAINDAGNGVGNWGSTWDGTNASINSIVGAPFSGTDGRANEALDPSTYKNGAAFDIQVYSKTATGIIGVANIRSVRITQADFNITKKGVAQDRFNFTALYVDGDGYVANASGSGQQNI